MRRIYFQRQRALHVTKRFSSTSKKKISKPPTPTRPRGTVDLLGKDCTDVAFVEAEGRRACGLFGYSEVRTPIFEFESTFTRGLGEESSVVNKEMYVFQDKSSNSLALRPENTAGVVRAVVNNWRLGYLARLFYHGPMFRYEKPQKGRQRQFTQFGVELLGHADVSADIEVIELANTFLKNIGLEKSTTLLVNSLGDVESRETYSKILQEYFQDKPLSEWSRNNLSATRVLRILDSKHKDDLETIKAAPSFRESLSSASALRFERLLEGLDRAGIQYTCDPTLVRGLDYYSHTVFEFVLRDDKSEQQQQRPIAVLAGGRYDRLPELYGFNPVPAIGWAAGIERLCLERSRTGTGPVTPSFDVFLIPMIQFKDCNSTKILNHTQHVARIMRGHNISALNWLEMMDQSVSVQGLIKKGFTKAESCDCRFVGLIGDAEASQGGEAVTIKNLESGQQKLCASITDISHFLHS